MTIWAARPSTAWIRCPWKPASFKWIRAHETGRVTVSLADGEPHYTIHEPAAWDFLELSDEWVASAERADAICFGSLAQRNRQARQTIQILAAESSANCIRVFDVNLRAPFYSAEVLQESLELATVVKMNDAEAPVVLDLLDLAIEEAPGHGRDAYRLRSICARRPNACSASSPPCKWLRHARQRGSLLVTATNGTSIPGFR